MDRFPTAVLALCALLLAFAGGARSALAPAQTHAAAALKARHAELREQLARNDFGRALVLDARESGQQLTGHAYAVIDHPFAKVESSLHHAANWCEILILPHNTKHCAAGEGGKALTLFIGRKNDTPLENAYRLDFRYHLAAHARDFLAVVLTAESGPLGTRDYRITLEAIPLEGGRTFLHLGYSYAYGMVSRLAMQAYLATVGASKVGFTVDGREASGEPRLARGMRGVMERNTMRYFLAIDAYLDSLSAPAGVRLQKRLHDWFAAAERFPRQLRESDLGQYLALKQSEAKRVQASL